MLWPIGIAVDPAAGQPVDRVRFEPVDLNLVMDGPSITGLLGRNGAGKTTLLRIIAAQEFASPSRG